MVILSACPTIWTAGAAHPCWGIPTGYGLRGERSRSMGYMPPSDLSELNPLATHAPWGLMQRLSPLHECGGAEVPPHWWTRFAAPTERTRERDAFKIRITSVQQQNEEQKL
jgi:hypothetical protein